MKLEELLRPLDSRASPRITSQDAAADTSLLTLVCLPPRRRAALYEKGKMRSETAGTRT